MITGKRKTKEVLTKDQVRKKPALEIHIKKESAVPSITATVTVGAKHGSRADLMAQAKARNIKYFRILSKSELQAVLDPNTHKDASDAIIENAVIRWKSGWKAKTVSNV